MSNEDRRFQTAEGTNDVSQFRIGPAYIDQWLHEPTHWETTPSQDVSLDALRNSLSQVLELRDAVQRARGEFGAVSAFYPDNYPSENQKWRLYWATTNFYQQYYAAIDKLTTFMRQYSDVFPSAPHRSVARFLEHLRPLALFPEKTIAILESARQFRTLLNHSASYQVFEWHTAATAEYYVRILFVGGKSDSGYIPEGSTEIEHPEDDFADALARSFGANKGESPKSQFSPGWYFIAPDEDLVTWALCVQLNAIVMRIAARRDNSAAVTCPWEPILTGDDVRLDYPVFAAEVGTVTGTWSTTYRATADVRFSGMDQDD